MKKHGPHEIEITWLGGYTLGSIQGEAHSKYGDVYIDITKRGASSWVFDIYKDEYELIATWYINNQELRSMLMYVQVNTHSEDETEMYGEVYSIGDNQKICAFKWTLSDGVVWTDPAGLWGTSIVDFIDEECTGMYYESLP